MATKWRSFLFRNVSIAPLVVFRIAFGLMMAASVIRFAAKGWIDSLFIQPKFFFSFFDWIKPPDGAGMYFVFAAMFFAAVCIAFGFLYRISTVAFFLLFTYVELIDKTNYLNHYYFISIIAFLMCFLPAHKNFSLDVLLGVSRRETTAPRWSILTLQLQMAIVYFFAGIAKINYDWLVSAIPLKIWLPSKYEVSLIGGFLDQPWVAYLFSWSGMLFDVTIAFFLFNRRTAWYAYAAVIVFHLLTAKLFPGIGMFPFIMIVCASVFLPAAFHERLLSVFSRSAVSRLAATPEAPTFRYKNFIPVVLALHFAVQLIMPLRYVFYGSNLFYTEEGYRFSWRVMLLEKAGYVVLQLKDPSSSKITEVNNSDYLTVQQEKQMSTQPDMILQFAHHLSAIHKNAEVYAEAYVSVNGRRSALLIDPSVNLAVQSDGFQHKDWILAKVAR